MFLPSVFSFCPSFWHNYQFTHIPKICVHPPNVLPEYQERMKNVGLYTHPRNIVHPPNVWHEYQDRIEFWVFSPIPEICFHPQMFSMNIRIELKMSGLYVGLYVGSL